MAPLALGQEKVYPDDGPYDPASYWVYSPEMGGYVNCESVDMSTPVFEICMENGIIPRTSIACTPMEGS